MYIYIYIYVCVYIYIYNNTYIICICVYIHICSLMLEKQKKDRADARELMSLFKDRRCYHEEVYGGGSIRVNQLFLTLNP